MNGDGRMRQYRRPHRRSRQRGITLLEVIVAMAASGFLLLAARQMFEVVSSGATAFAHAVDESERRANGEDLLRELLHALDAPVAEASRSGAWSLDGDPIEARFDTRCESAGGWMEPCQVVIRLDAADRSSPPHGAHAGVGLALTLHLPQGATVALSPGIEGVLSLLYLETAAGGGVWRERWERTAPPPLAVGLVRAADTLVVRVGSGL